jgi:hypothetical protein
VARAAFEEQTEAFTRERDVVKLNDTIRIVGLVAAISAGLYLQNFAVPGAESDRLSTPEFVVPHWRASLITVDVLGPPQS